MKKIYDLILNKIKKVHYFYYGIGLVILFLIILSNIEYKLKYHNAFVTVAPNKIYYDLITMDISKSTNSIVCAYYIIMISGEYTENLSKQLEDSANRGVEVKLLRDSNFESNFDYSANKKIKIVEIKNEKKMHSKVCIIDSKIVYIGSHNYTENALTKNQELSVRVESEAFAYETLLYLNSLID